MPARVFVYARDKPKAQEWCRANGVQPYARITHILGGSRDARGTLITPEDRVVFVGDVVSRRDHNEFMSSFLLSLYHVGFDKIEWITG